MVNVMVPGLVIVLTTTPTPAGTSTPSPSNVNPATPGNAFGTAIDASTAFWVLMVGLGLLVLVGLGSVVWFRFIQHGKRDSATSLTRPVLALLLVGTLVILAAASVGFSDPDLRKTLVGAVVSLSAAAAGFYFAAANAAEARRDLMTVASSNTTVAPNLVGKTIEEAEALMGRTDFALKKPSTPFESSDVVKSQYPHPGDKVARWQEIEVTL
jgi:hypothetical protein